MANQPDNVGIEETIYGTVIVGAGIAGLTVAYSGMRAARALGSTYVASEEKEIP
jgi:thioredoxin reductase